MLVVLLQFTYDYSYEEAEQKVLNDDTAPEPVLEKASFLESV